MADNAPDSAGDAPGSPLDLGTTGWRRTLVRGVRKYLRDRCGMMAGSLAFHWFVSLFPALIAVVGITSMVHAGTGTVQRLVDGLNRALPPGAANVFSQALHAANGRTHSGSLIVVIISVAVALWSASTGMTAWLYLVGVAILVGAELNAQTEREASAQAERAQAAPAVTSER